MIPVGMRWRAGPLTEIHVPLAISGGRGPQPHPRQGTPMNFHSMAFSHEHPDCAAAAARISPYRRLLTSLFPLAVGLTMVALPPPNAA